MPSARRVAVAESACLALFCVWLAWLPLPFGSNVPRARLPLIAVPLLLCAMAAAVRLYATRDRSAALDPTRPWLIWGYGSLLFVAVCTLQLVPLPAALLRVVSPESHTIWSYAAKVAALADVPVRGVFPVSVDPRATALELFRLAALIATFLTAALLIRTHTRRVALASVLCTAASFETLYGLREAALQRYEIWGWPNHLILNRVTGTFVNPNHFAHYLAIVLPLALFLLAAAWHTAAPSDVPFARRLALLLEHNVAAVGFAALVTIACVAGLLLAQSRGALLALAAGMLTVAALLPGRRVTRLALGGAAGAVLVAALVLYLGPERTVARFVPNEFERETLVGRRIGIAAAGGVWQRFPLLGSGLGTFERVVSLEQRQDLRKIYNRAHNDYAEIAATSGTVGAVIALVMLAGGYLALLRLTFGESAATLSWRRRAFQVAVLASVSIAMVHALFDFNFFIPSNPATLAAMCGAAVASVAHDKRMRR